MARTGTPNSPTSPLAVTLVSVLFAGAMATGVLVREGASQVTLAWVVALAALVAASLFPPVSSRVPGWVWGLLGVGLLAVLVVITADGAPSPYRVLLLAPMVGAAVTLPVRDFVITAAGTAAAFLGSIATTSGADLADRLLVAAVAIGLVSLVAWRQAHVRGVLRGLERANQQLDSLRRHHPDVVFTTDTEGRFEDVGDALCGLLGRSRPELLGRWSLTHVVKEDRAEFVDALDRVLAGEAVACTPRLLADDGVRRRLEVTLSPLLDDGEVVGVWGVGKDVTAEYRARRELEDLRHVLEMMDDTVFVLDPDDTRIRYVNGGAQRLYGWEREEMVGRRPVDLWPELTPQAIRRRAPAEGVGASRDEYKLRDRDGEARWVDVHLQRIGGMIVAVARDLSEKRAIAERLAASEREFRELAENVSEGLYRMHYGPEPAYEYANPAVEEILGYPADALLNDPGLVLTITHPEDRHILEDARRRREPIDGGVVLRVRRPDGAWRHVSVRERVVPDGSRERCGVLGVMVDVTDDRRREEALQRALEAERLAVAELEHVDSIRESFLQALSHELRTPLTSILGFAMLLQERAEDLPARRRDGLYERLVSNAQRLDALLADLLDVDRLRRGASVIAPRRVDLGRLVSEVIGGFHGRGRLAPPDLASVPAYIDPPKIERVVENLLANAVRHTPEDAGVHVSVRWEPGGTCRLDVEDEGPGIPDELKERMFEPFEQGRDAAVRPSPGTGIGLALVRQIVELHDGRVWVEDREGGGTRLCVRLPGAASEPAPVERSAGGAEAGGPTATVA